MNRALQDDVFEVMDGQRKKALIRVIGVGGGGCNTVNQMAASGIEGVEFICANTDRDHLERCIPTNQLQIGAGLTRGLGAGSDPKVGRQAAEEDRERIKELIEGTDLLFITAGMGGGTGTGAAPVIAQVAKELNVLTVAVVTKPFNFENRKRMNIAVQGLEDLRQFADSLIVIPNEKLSLVLGAKITMVNAFKAANDVLQNAVAGISELITRPGQLNVDFADVKTVMSNRGMAMMGMGSAGGDDRAKKAVELALSSPLLDDIELQGARGLLVNVSCDESLTMEEYQLINERVHEIASDEADAKCGMAVNPNLNGELRVTVVATGLHGGRNAAQQAPQAAVANPKVAQFIKPLESMPLPTRQADIEKPAVVRATQQRVAGGGGGSWPLDLDEKLINIPAFLRNQAD